MNRLSTSRFYGLYIVLLAGMLPAISLADALSAETTDGWSLRDADHYKLCLPEVNGLEEWESRKTEIREKLLLTAGLWPLPEKCPLNAQVFDEKSGEGFTVSKIYFESLPGFFATGNLYRPTAGSGPYPAILTPHGHWQFGRLQNGETGSIPGRCIDFARLGFVVLSLDMIGYNDSIQLPHDTNKSRAQLKADLPLPYEPNLFRAEFDFPRAGLYGFSLGGLQLWNSIRAIDFLSSMPEVDPARIGATGASGGATQTIFVMIADERVKVAAPVNIIGAEKHPGCRCENPAGLWIDISTLEMSASFSPKPLLLMSASEDPWTHSTPHREHPLIEQYYALYGAESNLRNVHVTAGHNYNAETRAAVYDWFCHHLSSHSSAIENPVPVSKEVASLGDLRVFPDGLLPEGSVSGQKVIENWISDAEKAYQQALPGSDHEFPGFVRRFRRALGLVMSVNTEEIEKQSVRTKTLETSGDRLHQLISISRADGNGSLEVEALQNNQPVKGNVLLVYPKALGKLTNLDSRTLNRTVESLLQRDLRLFSVRGFASGQVRIPQKTWETFSWPNAYNRNNQLSSIQDILLSLSYVSHTYPREPLIVVGLDVCGLETAFATALSGKADRVVLDLNGRDPGFDGELLELMPVGALKRVGDFRTAMLLLMQNEVVLFNTGPTFDRTWYLTQARKLGLEKKLRFQVGMNPIF